jgi:hypothetical protein
MEPIRWRLLRPIPGVKAGTLFEERSDDNPFGVPALFSVPDCRVRLEVNPASSPDWFERVIEDEVPEHWFLSGGDFSVSCMGPGPRSGWGDKQRAIGNYFATKEEAEEMRRRILALLADRGHPKDPPPIKADRRLDNLIEKGGPKRVPLPRFLTGG